MIKEAAEIRVARIMVTIGYYLSWKQPDVAMSLLRNMKQEYPIFTEWEYPTFSEWKSMMEETPKPGKVGCEVER